MNFILNASDANYIYSTDNKLSNTAKKFIIKKYTENILLNNNIIEENYIENKSPESCNKGYLVQDNNALFCQEVLKLKKLNKNEEKITDKYFCGICDYINDDLIVEIKSPFTLSSFYNNLYNDKKDYYLQLQIYLYLYKKKKGILFYGLQNYKNNNYNNLKSEQKWAAYEVEYNKNIILKFIEIIKESNEYLNNYIEMLNCSLGTINKIDSNNFNFFKSF